MSNSKSKSKAGMATTKYQPTLSNLGFAAHVTPSLTKDEKRDNATAKRLKKSGYKTPWELTQERLNR